MLEVLESHLLLMLVLEEVPMLEALASCADGYRTPMATRPLPASCASSSPLLLWSRIPVNDLPLIILLCSRIPVNGLPLLLLWSRIPVNELLVIMLLSRILVNDLLFVLVLLSRIIDLLVVDAIVRKKGPPTRIFLRFRRSRRSKATSRSENGPGRVWVCEIVANVTEITPKTPGTNRRKSSRGTLFGGPGGGENMRNTTNRAQNMRRRRSPSRATITWATPAPSMAPGREGGGGGGPSNHVLRLPPAARATRRHLQALEFDGPRGFYSSRVSLSGSILS